MAAIDNSTGKICPVEGCDKPLHGAHYCDSHYRRWKKYGDPRASAPPRQKNVCGIDGCEDCVWSHGLCRTHEYRVRKHGSPDKPKRKHLKFITTAIERETDDCIEWPFHRDNSGYGKTNYKGRSMLAHRVALALSNGTEIPPPSILCCHHCDNPSCINPRHLYFGTHSDNSLDCLKRRRTNRKVLTFNEVRQIRGSNESPKELAKRFGLHYVNVINIRNRKTWCWLVDDTSE